MNGGGVPDVQFLDVQAHGERRVARLRELVRQEERKRWRISEVLRYDADLIEELLAQRKELREALEHVARGFDAYYGSPGEDDRRKGFEALLNTEVYVRRALRGRATKRG